MTTQRPLFPFTHIPDFELRARRASQRTGDITIPEGPQASRVVALAVARFRFSRRAEADLLSIGDYTLRTWGKTQATHYIGELQVCCQTLAAGD